MGDSCAAIFQSLFRYEPGATLSDILLWGELIEGRLFSKDDLSKSLGLLLALNFATERKNVYLVTPRLRKTFGDLKMPVDQANALLKEFLQRQAGTKRVKMRITQKAWFNAMAEYHAKAAEMYRS